jgi:hypothetical protein
MIIQTFMKLSALWLKISASFCLTTPDQIKIHRVNLSPLLVNDGNSLMAALLGSLWSALFVTITTTSETTQYMCGAIIESKQE